MDNRLVNWSPLSVEPAGLSIVIPAYNEAQAIGPVLTEILKIMAEYSSIPGGFPYEVIVVDDGSSDQTARVVSQVAGVRLARHPSNRGYGAALKTGIRQAHYNLVCITDADGTYPNVLIPALAAGIVERGFDMVVGARTGSHVSIPLVRRPAKWFLNRLANFVAGSGIPDLNSGLRVFRRRDALVFLQLLPDGFSFTTTLTLGFLTNGYTLDYVPIDYFRRVGHSKIRPIQDTLNFVQLISRIALYFARSVRATTTE